MSSSSSGVGLCRWLGLGFACAAPAGLAPAAQGPLFDFVWEGTGDDWSVNGAWDQPGWPAAAVDRAFLGILNPPIKTAYLSRDIEVGALDMISGMDVYTSGPYGSHQLVVRGPTRILEGAKLEVWPEGAAGNSDFDTDDLTLGDIGLSGMSWLRLNNGAVAEVDDLLTITPEGGVGGEGELRILGAATAINDGEISADDGGELWVRPSPGNTAAIDLDGSGEDGRLSAIGGHLRITADLSDAILNGPILIANGGELSFDEPWFYAGSPNPNGNLLQVCCDTDAVGGDGNASVISGAEFTLTGDMEVRPGGILRLDAETNFGSTSYLYVDDGPNPGEFPSVLILNAPATFFPGSRISMGGSTIVFRVPASLPSDTLSPGGAASSTILVQTNVTIGNGFGSFDIFDWDGFEADGFASATNTDISEGASLTLNPGQIDPGGIGPVNQYDGVVTLRTGSMLVVNVDADSWAIGGEMNILPTCTVTGDTVEVVGDVNALGVGTSYILSAATKPGGVIDADANSTLQFSELTLDGGQLTGEGTIQLIGFTTEVTDDTDVNMPNGVFDIDPAFPSGQLLDIGAELTISAQAITGDPFTPVEGPVLIDQGGELAVFLSADDEYDLDHLELRGADFPDTEIKISGPDRVAVHETLDITGHSVLTAPLRLADGALLQVGNAFNSLRLNGGTQLFPNVFEAGSEVQFIPNLPGALRLGGWTIIEDGAVFNSNTNLFVSGYLQLDGDTSLAFPNTTVTIIDGPLVPGPTLTAEHVFIHRVHQEITGQINLRVTDNGEADKITLLDGDASSLLGSLIVAQDPGFTPSGCFELEIITATAGVPDYDFNLVLLPVGWSLVEDGASLRIRFSDCVADLAEPFCALDFSDVFAFLVAFGTMDPAADLAEPVGIFDFSDVFAFLTSFGAGCP